MEFDFLIFYQLYNFRGEEIFHDFFLFFALLLFEGQDVVSHSTGYIGELVRGVSDLAQEIHHLLDDAVVIHETLDSVLNSLGFPVWGTQLHSLSDQSDARQCLASL